MVKTIILDCDGVMFDSRNANRHYYNFLLSNFGYGDMDEAEVDFVHIHSVYDSVDHIFRHYPKQDIDEVHAFRKEHTYRPFLKYMEIEPNLISFLSTARENYNLAIATNRTDTMIPLLEEFELGKYFGKIMTADNSRKPKPAPDPLLEIIEHFNCTISESIYVGDSEIDEKTAAGCGMQFVAFNNSELTANYYVKGFNEVLSLPPFGTKNDK